jgi:hypothetical protein
MEEMNMKRQKIQFALTPNSLRIISKNGIYNVKNRTAQARVILACDFNLCAEQSGDKFVEHRESDSRLDGIGIAKKTGICAEQHASPMNTGF